MRGPLDEIRHDIAVRGTTLSALALAMAVLTSVPLLVAAVRVGLMP